MLHFLIADRFYRNKLYFVNTMDDDNNMDEDESEWTEEKRTRITNDLVEKFRGSLEKLSTEEKKQISKGCGIKNTPDISPENLARLTVEMKIARSKQAKALHIIEQILISSQPGMERKSAQQSFRHCFLINLFVADKK